MEDPDRLWDRVVSELSLWRCRSEVNVGLVVSALHRYAVEVDLYQGRHRIQRQRDARLRRANRRRGPGAPWLPVTSSWQHNPELGNPLLEMRAWARYQLAVAGVPERLQPRLLDVLTEWQASPYTGE